MLTTMKGEIDSNTIIVGDINTPLIPMDRSSKQKINKETQALNDTTDQIDLTDIYRTFHPPTHQSNNRLSTHWHHHQQCSTTRYSLAWFCDFLLQSERSGCHYLHFIYSPRLTLHNKVVSELLTHTLGHEKHIYHLQCPSIAWQYTVNMVFPSSQVSSFLPHPPQCGYGVRL